MNAGWSRLERAIVICSLPVALLLGVAVAIQLKQRAHAYRGELWPRPELRVRPLVVVRPPDWPDRNPSRESWMTVDISNPLRNNISASLDYGPGVLEARRAGATNRRIRFQFPPDRYARPVQLEIMIYPLFSGWCLLLNSRRFSIDLRPGDEVRLRLNPSYPKDAEDLLQVVDWPTSRTAVVRRDDSWPSSDDDRIQIRPW